MDTEQYALIHCHTPVGGMLARLAARKARRAGTRVVYTAHGLHFYRGAPLRNWLLFYPAERALSRLTDLLLTINGEDEARARRMHAVKTERVEGVGIDLTRFDAPVDRVAVRAALGLAPDAPVVITVGEHIPRKNHAACLRALAELPGVTLLFCGVGELAAALEAQAQALGIADRVRFLGFRRDVPALLAASDVFLFPSFQEGLPVALMEAMAAGLPCVVSDVRGNTELIGSGDGGFRCNPENPSILAEAVRTLLADPMAHTLMGERNRTVIQAYGLPRVRARMAALYEEQLAGRGAH